MDEARTFSGKQRTKLAKGGQAMKDGSFPIANKQDLRNAIQAYGRASNKAAAKRHIIKRARALGATNLLPDDWKNGDSAMAETAEGIVTKPHKFSPQPDKPSLCASCNKTRSAGPHVKASSDKASDEAESFHDTMSALRRAVRKDVGRRAYLVDAGPDWVVYERYDDDCGEYLFIRRSYTGEGASITLGDDSTEVLRTTVYVPVAKQDSASGLVEIWGATLATENVQPPREVQ